MQGKRHWAQILWKLEARCKKREEKAVSREGAKSAKGAEKKDNKYGDKKIELRDWWLVNDELKLL